MKKHLVSVIAVVCMLMTSAFALTREQINTADALNYLGLFNGTDEGYQYNVQLKRSDGITLLVRLLGKEADAANGKYSHPFTDVADWLDPYVAYAYNAGYTTGTGATTYGSDKTMSRAEFYTVVLRALGYTDAGETPDFTWADAAAFGKSIGLTDSDMSKTKFSRADAIEVFWKALDLQLKGESRTLCDKLLADGVFTAAELAEAKKLQSNPKPNEEMVVNERTGNLITKRQAIVEKVAYSFWDKRMHTDYDQRSAVHSTTLDPKAPNKRRENRGQPETASPEHRLYLDCSGFIFASYYDMYGEAMTDIFPWEDTAAVANYAKKGETDDVIYYHEFTTNTMEEYRTVYAEMMALLEPGDAFNYRRASTGHIVMYMDGGLTLESTGSDYKVRQGRDMIDEEGTIKVRDIGYFIDPERSTNVLTKNTLVSICIIRPLNVLNDLEISERATSRLDMGRFAATKLCVMPGQTVETGDTLTFTIELDNQPESDTSKALSFDVTDPLPSNVRFVSATNGGELVDGVVTWKNVSVAAGEVKKLSYTVTVTGEKGFVESGETKVGGINFTYRDLQIGTNMSDAEFAALKAKLDEGMAEGQTALSYINAAYEAALGTGLDVDTYDELFGCLYKRILDGNGNQRFQRDIDEDSKVGKAAVDGYVLGRRVMNLTQEDYNSRVRYLREETLRKGDLLMVNDLMLRTNYYIYLGADQPFLRITDEGISTANVYQTLDGLLAQPLFTLLRPSLI